MQYVKLHAYKSLFIAAALCLLPLSFGQRHQSYDNRAGVPEWQVDSEFKKDVFTFARVRYTSTRGGGGHRGWGYGRRGRGGGGWQTDYPDAELNFAYRLQQMTSLKVNPDSVVVELTQGDLFNYPFLYIECYLK